MTVERSQNERTHYEVTNGVKVDRGWSSPMFINDHKRDECIMEDVKVLVCDGEIGNILDIEKVLKPIINNRERLLIIAPCSLNVVNTLAANVMKNGLKVCNISPPSFGYRQHELMQDIALSVGATYFSEKTGDDLRLIEYSDLGDASKVIVGKDETIIVKSSGVTEEVEARIGQLWEQHKLLEHDSEREFVLSRIASLSGGIGVIYVGGNTDLEQKELYDRVDDAVCAVRAALSDGILPGGGVAYNNREVEFAAPKGGGQGMDLKSGKQGNMIDMGIVDPTLVTKSALRNAASVAITFMSTKTIIHNTSDTMNPIISAKKI